MDGANKWKLDSITPPQWKPQLGDIGTVYDPGCHAFLFTHSQTGELLHRDCTLPHPDTDE